MAEEITPQQLSDLQGVRIVDVRQPEEFTGPLGHLPGAELVPLDTLPQAAADWDREAPLLLVCRSGGRSGHAAQLLSSMGFARPINLAGGMIAVSETGLDVER